MFCKSMSVFALFALVACAEEEGRRHKKGHDRDEASTEVGFEEDVGTNEDRGDDDDDDDDVDTATLIFENESTWRSFNWMVLEDCGGNLAASYNFPIDDWLLPGQTWTLTGVPTDQCFQAELWNFNVDYGVEFYGTVFEPGDHHLVITD